MQRKKKSKQTFKIILIVLLVLIMIAIVTIAIINILKPVDALKGTFKYCENVKYEFDGKGSGAMYDSGTEYKYTYIIEGDTLKIDFKPENIYDATYTFKIESNTLTLIGREGTTGGEYLLEKENN